jgi:glutaredoxin-related protein
VPVRVRPSAPTPLILFIEHSVKEMVGEIRMGKNIHFVLLVLVIIIAAGFFFMSKGSSEKKLQSNTRIIYFYSTQCPHCENVKAFLANNDIRNKVIFDEKEVSQNRDNLIQLVKIRELCHLPKEKYVSVPFLWTGSECLVGDQNIIKFFKEKI